MESFYIKFTISDPERFKAAEKAFNRLRECKERNEWSEELEAWKPYFDERALGHFFGTTPETPGTYPEEAASWDFLSMIDAFRNGDYQLESLQQLGGTEGRLTFDPFGWPYGGTGCMKAFLDAFGMTVIEERC